MAYQWNKDWGITFICLIHESQALASVGQHDLRIKAFNKGNIYLSAINEIRRQLSKLSLNICIYIQGVTGVNLVISITLQCNSLPVRSHNYVNRNKRSFIHSFQISNHIDPKSEFSSCLGTQNIMTIDTCKYLHGYSYIIDQHLYLKNV